MYVCICHAVTEDEVRDAVADGASTTEEIAARCGAGTGCGTCVGKLCALIERSPEEGALASAP